MHLFMKYLWCIHSSHHLGVLHFAHTWILHNGLQPGAFTSRFCNLPPYCEYIPNIPDRKQTGMSFTLFQRTQFERTQFLMVGGLMAQEHKGAACFVTAGKE